jgi:streptogramin lyase
LANCTSSKEKDLMFEMKKITIFYLLFQVFSYAFAQENIPLGTWRVHLPYRSVKSLAASESKVYAVAQSGIFVYDLEDNSTQILSKNNGLAEAQASQIAYSTGYQKVIIGYFNGNIDIISGKNIINLSAIRNSTIIAENLKNINHIFLQGSWAYLATNFGVIVVDLEKNEIRETWRNLGTGGNNLAVNAIASDGLRFYLATPQGVRFASVSANLQDFNNWQFFGMGSGLPANVAVQNIAFSHNVLYASLEGFGLYKLISPTTWQVVAGMPINGYNNLQNIDNQLAVSQNSQVIWLNSAGIAGNLSNPIFQKINAIQKINNRLWVADAINGLLSDWEGSFKSYSPNGTFSIRNWKSLYFAEKILALSGGYNSSYANLNNTDGFDIFSEGFWQSYHFQNLSNTLPMPFAFDLNCATYNASQKILSIGSFGNGIIEQNTETGTFNVVDETTPNTPFFGASDVRISALATDNQGNLWAGRYGANNSLLCRRANGTWQSFGFNTATRFPEEIVIDFRGYKWIRLSPTPAATGVWVCDTEGGQNKHLTPTNGKLTNPNILSIAIDRNGVIWLGSESGVMTVFNPQNVFNSNFEVTFPIFERRQLLESIAVTAIAIDGANRKWFGTRNNGVYLFDATVSNLLAHFTAENSPLISNQIRHISINDKNGEVFITTNQGLCSYREGVTRASENLGKVKVFPNPVKPDFSGLVGIEGLAENAEVKITDVSGTLIYQTNAKGGTATWNVRDYNGRRAAPGIYLVFSVNAEGEAGEVAKIAVL